MGLDMYLEKMVKCNQNEMRNLLDEWNNCDDSEFYEKANASNINDIIGAFKGLDVYCRGSVNYKYPSLEIEVGYWRKANHIHTWFVENVQNGNDDCKPYIVSKEQLENLLSDCKKVYGRIEEPEDILPTQSGFFFGSTDYGEFYWQSISNTIEIIEKILNDTDFESEMIIYNSSW